MLADDRYHNGLVFSDLGKLSVPVVATMAMDEKHRDQKLSMKGELLVEVHEGSYKYPHSEAVIVVWGRVFPTVEVRASDKYPRAEIVIPGGLREAYEFFSSVACMLDAKLKGF